MDVVNDIYINNMVYNTITNNMENTMKKEVMRYSEATKKNALSLLGKGWTVAEIAKKHNTSVPTIHYWKKQYPELVTKTIVTSISKNGVAKANTIKAKKKKPTSVTVTLSVDFYKQITSQAKDDCRTIEGQVKYYVLNGIRNYSSIPF